MIEIKTFNSDKDLSRFEFIKRAILFIIIIVVAHFVLQLKYAQRTNPPSEKSQLIFDLICIVAVTIWTFSSKIVTQFLLDFDNKIFIINYITLIRGDQTIEIDFTSLSFTFKKTPSRANAKKWTLDILQNDKKKLSIGTDDNGFSQETLEELVTQLKEVAISKT